STSLSCTLSLHDALPIYPARPKRQLIGVFSPHLTMLFADVLRQLACERAWIVSGTAVDTLAMDDVSTIGPTVVAEVNSGKIRSRSEERRVGKERRAWWAT